MELDKEGILTKEKLKDVVDEADCGLEVCFTSEHGRELLGWATTLLKATAKAQRDAMIAAGICCHGGQNEELC